MSRVVNTQHTHEAIIAQLKPRNRAVSIADPNGPQLRRIERAHQVQRENADRPRVTEDGDLSSLMLRDDFVEFLPRAIEQLAITLAASQHVFEVASQQRGVLLGMLLRGVLKRQ